MQYVPGNMKQIDDILVPQIEEEIAEVIKSLDRVQQYPERLLLGNRSVSGMSLYETGIRSRFVWSGCCACQSTVRCTCTLVVSCS